MPKDKPLDVKVKDRKTGKRDFKKEVDIFSATSLSDIIRNSGKTPSEVRRHAEWSESTKRDTSISKEYDRTHRQTAKMMEMEAAKKAAGKSHSAKRRTGKVKSGLIPVKKDVFR